MKFPLVKYVTYCDVEITFVSAHKIKVLSDVKPVKDKIVKLSCLYPYIYESQFYLQSIRNGMSSLTAKMIPR